MFKQIFEMVMGLLARKSAVEVPEAVEETEVEAPDVEAPEVSAAGPVSIVNIMSVRLRYKDGWTNKKRLVAPTELVVHGTGGGTSVDGLIKWMLDGEFAAKYLTGVGLFHYTIGRGEKGEIPGMIAEVISPDYWVHHASSGSKAKYQIGVELINPSKSNRDPFTQEQYDSLISLWLDYLRPRYPSLNKVVGHRWSLWKYNSINTASREDKQCPGDGFNWNILLGELTKRGLKFKDIGTPGKQGYEIV